MVSLNHSRYNRWNHTLILRHLILKLWFAKEAMLVCSTKIMSSESDKVFICMSQLGLGGSEEENCSRNMVHLS